MKKKTADNNTLVHNVDKKPNKTMIKIAIRKSYGKKVAEVNTLIRLIRPNRKKGGTCTDSF